MDAKLSDNTKTFIGAMITVILWASAFPAVKASLVYYSAESIMLFRFLVACATLTVLAVVKKMKRPKVKDMPLFALGGFIGIFLYMWLFNTGTKFVASGVSSFVIASSPVFTAIFCWILLKEKMRAWGYVGIFISFLGLVLIMVSQTTGFALNFGVLLLIGAAVSTSFYSIIQRRILQSYTALEATTYSVYAATLFMLVFLPGFLRELPSAPMAINWIIAYMGVFPAALAYLSWNYALSKATKTASVTMFLYLVPFAASLMAYIWLHETFALLSFIGGVVIIAGMVVTSKKA